MEADVIDTLGVAGFVCLTCAGTQGIEVENLTRDVSFARHGAGSSEHALQDEVFATAQAHRILKQRASLEAPAWLGNLGRSRIRSRDRQGPV